MKLKSFKEFVTKKLEGEPGPKWLRDWLGPLAKIPHFSFDRGVDKNGKKTWKVKIRITW